MKERRKNIMIAPKEEGEIGQKKLMRAKMWLMSREIKVEEITISIAISSNSKRALSAELTLWERILFRLNFWGKFNSDRSLVFG